MEYINNLYNMDNIKKLSSKRNSVWLVKNGDNLEVIKKFKEREFFNKELKIYHLLEKDNIIGTLNYPQIIDFKQEEMLIKFQYIEGETLLSILERYEKNNDIESGIRLMMLLFNWIDMFQNSLTKVKYVDQLFTVGIDLDFKDDSNDEKTVSLVDINFKNFIQKGNKLYGLDFENVNIGKRITDYTKSLAYMITYNPIATDYKKNILYDLLSLLNTRYSFSNETSYRSYNEELSKIEIRRGLSIKDLYI